MVINMSQPVVKGVPVYGIGFVDAIRNGYAHYLHFEGKASRSQFWYWTLFSVLAGFVGGFIVGFIEGFRGNAEAVADGSSVLYWLFVIAVVVAFTLPTISVSVRRLRDAGFSPWLYLLSFIPWVGLLVLIILCSMPTKNPPVSGYVSER